MKRIVSAILLVILITGIVQALTACNNNAESVPTEAPASETTTTETEGSDPLEARKLISDGLPQMNFDGAEYRISAMTSRQYEAYSESETGEICNDAVYKRNRTVEERFGVKISVPLINDTDYVKSVTNTIMAGDDVYDVSTMNTYLANSLITKGLYQNWSDVNYINYDKPWWIKRAIDSYTVNGYCYVIIGSFNITTLLRTYAVFFNSRLTEDYRIEAVYQLVNDGMWTIDKLNELTKDIYLGNL